MPQYIIFSIKSSYLIRMGLNFAALRHFFVFFYGYCSVNIKKKSNFASLNGGSIILS